MPTASDFLQATEEETQAPSASEFLKSEDLVRPTTSARDFLTESEPSAGIISRVASTIGAGNERMLSALRNKETPTEPAWLSKNILELPPNLLREATATAVSAIPGVGPLAIEPVRAALEEPTAKAFLESSAEQISGLTSPKGLAVTGGFVVAPEIVGPIVALQSIPGAVQSAGRFGEKLGSGDMVGAAAEAPNVIASAAGMMGAISPIEAARLARERTPPPLPSGEATPIEPIRGVPEVERAAPAEKPYVEPITAATETTAEPIGMGGAVPSEFEPPVEQVTGIKVDSVDQQREARGLPPLMKPATQELGAAADAALRKMAEDPGIQDRLIDELKSNPRPMDQQETFMVLQRMADLRNEYERAAQDGIQAEKDGRTDDIASAKTRLAQISDQLADTEQAASRGGAASESGRSLQALKMLMNEDYSLASLDTQLRAAKNFEPLTDADHEAIQTIHDDYAAKSKSYEDMIASRDQRISELETQAVLDRSKAREQAQPTVEPHIKVIADKIKSYFDQRATAALGRLQSATFTISPQVLADLTDLGVSKILGGAAEFTGWSAEMVKALGDKVTPHLKTIWESAQTSLEDTVKRFATPEETKRVSRATRKLDITEQRTAATEAISAKVSAGEKSGITPLVQKLARSFVADGVNTRDALVDKVHEVLKTVMPDITRRKTMDAISGYGDFKQLTKDEISVKLRDIKGQLQQVSKLEDIQKGQPPSKTGIERRTPSDEERRLIKQVNDAMRRSGIKTTDPATQLRSALESRKTYYRNQIYDLEKQIADKQKFVKDKTASPTDPELEALKARRTELKQQFDDIFGKPGISDEQRLKVAVAAAEKNLASWQERLADARKGIFDKARPQRPAVSSPQLESVRSQTESAKAEVEHLRSIDQPLVEKRSQEALAKRKSDLEKQIADAKARLAAGEIGTKPKTTRASRPLSPELEKAKQELEEVNRQIVEARKSAKPKVDPQAVALKALKSRLSKQLADLQDRIANGDFSARPRRTLKLDEEAMRAKAAVQDVKDRFERMKQAEEMKRRTGFEKAMSAISAYRRGFVLSSLGIVRKLFFAAQWRSITTPVEDIIGSGLSKLPGVSKISERAPIEGGGINLRAQIDAKVAGWTKGLRDAYEKLTSPGGLSQLEVAHGKKPYGLEGESGALDPKILRWFAYTHGALKAQVFREHYTYAMKKLEAWNAAQGVDTSGWLEHMRISNQAMEWAYRSILLQNNAMVDGYKRFMSRLTQKDKATGRTDPALLGVATALRMEMPIVKVPTNIAAETMDYLFGTMTGSARAARAIRAGVENLSQPEADMIMRKLKKGTLGLPAAVLVGYLLRNQIGGFWMPGGKQAAGEQDDVKPGEMRIGDYTIPESDMHHPLLSAVMYGATVGKAADTKIRKSDAEPQGLGEGIVAASLGLADLTPFAREASDFARALEPAQRQRILGQRVQSYLVPGAVSWIARHSDTDSQGEPVKRKASTIPEYIEMGVPGMRQNLPVATPPRGARSYPVP